MTRLAELTHLDRIGLPVWQAVRPMSRALSVHQGKGATDADAQIGALMEAVESHHAETFDAPGPICRLDALPRRRRAPLLSDFARDPRALLPPDAAHRWAEATGLVSGKPFFLPFQLVSLDLTRDVPSPFDRSSNGLATGGSHDEALAVALQEIVERDAVTEWRHRDTIARMADSLVLASVPFGWLHAWRERLERAGAIARFFRIPSIVGMPTFVCELNDLEKPGAPYRAINGRGCHPVPELALFKALAEAVQSRATFIAGARDDLLPSAYSNRIAGTVAVAFSLPPAPRMRGVTWDEIGPGPAGAGPIGEALVRAGYPEIAFLPLGNPNGFHVIKAFVCGLGGSDRRRRAPCR